MIIIFFPGNHGVLAFPHLFFPRKNDCEVGWSLADAWKKYAQKLLDGDLPGCQPVAKRSSGMDQPPPRNHGGWYRFGIIIRDV